jgi:hypothetical protein
MANFPQLFAGSAALYPVTIGEREPVTVLQFDDRTEQRFRESATLYRFVLALNELTTSEVDAILAFYASTKGGFDTTWSLTLGGKTYNNLAFTDSQLAPVFGINGTWSLQINIMRTKAH